MLPHFHGGGRCRTWCSRGRAGRSCGGTGAWPRRWPVSGGRCAGGAPRGLDGGWGAAGVGWGVAAGGAELGEFVAVGVGLVFGAFGAGAQVGAQFLAFAGRVGAYLAEHLLGVDADPSGFGLGGAGGGLGAGGLLLGLAGSGLGGGCRLAGLVTMGLGGADSLLGLGAGLGDGGVPFGCGGCDALISVGAGLPHRVVSLLLGGGGAVLGGLGQGLGGGQVLAHVLGGGIGLGAELVSGSGALLGSGGAGFGGGGALVCGGADGFDFGFGGGRVGERADLVPQPGT